MDDATLAAVNADHAKFRAQPLDPFHNPGKTIGDAHDAFAKVANKENWKYPVRAMVKCSAEEAGFIVFSCNFMCGGGGDAFPLDDGHYEITHPGYYAVIGA